MKLFIRRSMRVCVLSVLVATMSVSSASAHTIGNPIDMIMAIDGGGFGYFCGDLNVLLSHPGTFGTYARATATTYHQIGSTQGCGTSAVNPCGFSVAPQLRKNSVLVSSTILGSSNAASVQTFTQGGASGGNYQALATSVIDVGNSCTTRNRGGDWSDSHSL